MALISESQVRLSDVKSVFGGGSPPNNLTAYYSGSGTETDPSALAYPPLNVVGLNGFVPASGTIQLTDYLGATKANITADTYEANSQVIGGTGETVSGILTLANDGRMTFEDVYNEITTDVLDEWTLGSGSSSINMNTYFRFVFNVTSATVSDGGSITVAGDDVATGYTGNIFSDVPGTVLVQAIRGSAGSTRTTTVTFNLLVVRRDTSATVVQKAITVRAVAVNNSPD